MKAKNAGAADGVPVLPPARHRLFQALVEHARQALADADGRLANADKRTSAGATATPLRRPPEYYHGRIDAFAEMLRLCQTLQGL